MKRLTLLGAIALAIVVVVQLFTRSRPPPAEEPRRLEPRQHLPAVDPPPRTPAPRPSAEPAPPEAVARNAPPPKSGNRIEVSVELGTRRVDFPHRAPTVGGGTTTYRTLVGTQELVVIDRTPCSDTKSGELFDNAVTVTLEYYCVTAADECPGNYCSVRRGV